MCKGRVFAEKECLALVAAIVTMWDIEPVVEEEEEKEKRCRGGDEIGEKEKAKGQWKIPEHRKATAVAWPKEDVRVRIKRREGVGC